MKKKILWMTNVRFTQTDIKSTGTWLQPLAEELSKDVNFEIYHVTLGNVENIYYEKIGQISQYLIPTNNIKLKRNSLFCNNIRTIIDDINPDIVHIWGTESVWFLMNKFGVYSDHTVLLDMQGLLKSCYESYYGGLSFIEQIKCIGLKEILKPSSSVWFVRNLFRKRAKEEEKSLKLYKHISYQSQWMRNRLCEFGLEAKLYGTKIILRDEFYHHRWRPTDNISPVLFTIMSSTVPYKGLHVLIKACSIIKKRYPDFILNVVGGIFKGKYNVKTGYESYLQKLINKYDMITNINFCGSLSSSEIAEIQLKSDVAIVPSFVESYCLGMAESMMIGLPVVAAYSAALPTIAKDKDEVLFYSSMDYIDCAIKIICVFEEKTLAMNLSHNAIDRRVKDNNIENAVNTQKNIYNEVVDYQN